MGRSSGGGVGPVGSRGRSVRIIHVLTQAVNPADPTVAFCLLVLCIGNDADRARSANLEVYWDNLNVQYHTYWSRLETSHGATFQLQNHKDLAMRHRMFLAPDLGVVSASATKRLLGTIWLEACAPSRCMLEFCTPSTSRTDASHKSQDLKSYGFGTISRTPELPVLRRSRSGRFQRRVAGVRQFPVEKAHKCSVCQRYCLVTRTNHHSAAHRPGDGSFDRMRFVDVKWALAVCQCQCQCQQPSCEWGFSSVAQFSTMLLMSSIMWSSNMHGCHRVQSTVLNSAIDSWQVVHIVSSGLRGCCYRVLERCSEESS